MEHSWYKRFVSTIWCWESLLGVFAGLDMSKCRRYIMYIQTEYDDRTKPQLRILVIKENIVKIFGYIFHLFFFTLLRTTTPLKCYKRKTRAVTLSRFSSSYGISVRTWFWNCLQTGTKEKIISLLCGIGLPRAHLLNYIAYLTCWHVPFEHGTNELRRKVVFQAYNISCFLVKEKTRKRKNIEDMKYHMYTLPNDRAHVE